MKTLTQQLTNYATYHRDRRNIATHFVGIPMIVLAIATLLSRPSLQLAGLSLSPATITIALACAYYLRLELRLGATMTALMALAGWAGAAIAAHSTGIWLGLGLGLFVVGWVFQFVGHIYEGRKPAFVDDLIGLLIGPLFVVAEATFALGLRLYLRNEIERGAGPTRVGRATESAQSTSA
jgi:uncharacterized membrane protein YGL010W